MRETFYERIGESCQREKLGNGLSVCVVPKPGYRRKYAFFAARYGGMTPASAWRAPGGTPPPASPTI